MAYPATSATPGFHSPDGVRNFLFLGKMPSFVVWSLGFSQMCLKGVISPEHVVPVVL